MSTPTLPDPRRYTAADHPLNLLARQLMAQSDLGRMVSSEAALDAEMNRLLDAEDNHGLNAAFAGVGSQAELRVLHERLRAILARPSAGETRHTVPFALPIVLVAGSRGEMTLPGQLPKIEDIKRLLTEHGIFAADADIFLSNHLVDRDSLLDVGYSQLLSWRNTVQFANDGLSMPLTPAPITFKGDGVYLRYLVGAVVESNDGETAVKLNASPAAWSMALSKMLGEQLAQNGLTLFTLPRAPLAWLTAIEDGRVAQQEIRFQVYVSNTLRDLRQKGETPVAILSTHENGELRVTIGSKSNGEEWAGFVWPLGGLDRIESIQQMMMDLLRECHHDDIRVIPEVLPTVKDNLPYFPLPTELANTATQH